MNRLARAQSPYLQQHATNPVDWHEWGVEALELARNGKRPIMLSIGYAACHWCHVMERESFAEEVTAAALNADFVSIKVDREERPDLDKIYQLSHQLLSRRSGGWPLTVFLDPHDHSPIYTGTYFPPQRRHGLPAFREVLGGVLHTYRTRGAEIKAQNEQLRAVLDAQAVRSAADFDGGCVDALAEQAAAALAERFDERFGGFGGAPKFPHPGWLEMLAELAAHGDAAAGRMLDRTLAAMALSGLYDHLNGGFFRYSVDERFEIPHFEKMLYDNAQLLPLYAERAQRVPELRALFESAARGIRTWLDQELATGGGLYASALDADSDHLEGRYYVYSRDEVEGALEADQASVAVPLYGLDLPANFEGHAWHLRVAKSPEALRSELGWSATRFASQLDGARDRLKALRATRTRPMLDYKLLTSCNALAACGLSRAGRALDDATYGDRAATIVTRLSNAVGPGCRINAQYTGGTGSGAATLDDVALSLNAALEVLADQVTAPALRLATTLADQLISDFADPSSGAFWYTTHDHERLFSRPMQLADEALPSAYAWACRALAELGYWLAEPRWLEAAERALGAAQPAVSRFPEAHAHLLLAMRSYRQPRPMLTVCAAATSFAAWRERLTAALRRGELRLYLVDIADRELPAALAAKTGTARGRGYWCEGLVCRERIEGPEGLAALGL